jgi:NADPH:quinone reductase
MRAVRIHETGGPEVLRVDQIDLPEPDDGEVLVRVDHAGLNFLDTYQRSGAYPMDLPFTAGNEGAGEIVSVGDGVTAWDEGDAVAFVGVTGTYAEYIAAPADRCVRVPAGVGTRLAAAASLQGMTAHYLAHSTYVLDEGDIVLIYAAAGGVGHLLVQIAKLRGATVLATASTEEKAELSRATGADEVILYRDVSVPEAVAELTEGVGVDVVYDSIGADTFAASLDCLRTRGYLVLYGQSSGPVDPMDPQVLNRKGSLFLTRPSLAHYIARREELEWRARDLYGWIASGQVAVRIDREFALEDAAEAHRYMEAGATSGKVLITP